MQAHKTPRPVLCHNDQWCGAEATTTWVHESAPEEVYHLCSECYMPGPKWRRTS